MSESAIRGRRTVRNGERTLGGYSFLCPYVQKQTHIRIVAVSRQIWKAGRAVPQAQHDRGVDMYEDTKKMQEKRGCKGPGILYV